MRLNEAAVRSSGLACDMLIQGERKKITPDSDPANAMIAMGRIEYWKGYKAALSDISNGCFTIGDERS